MSASNFQFNGVSLVITHFNRSSSLGCLLSAFENLRCSFEAVIVSDDGSRPEHLSKVQELQQRFQFTLLTTPLNKGLGHNNNVSQDAVKTEYTLYVQEDFVPKPVFPELFEKSMKLMRLNPDIDIIRYYSYFSYPYLLPYDEDFSLLDFHPEPWYANHRKFYFYSDHPHVRRSNFFSKFGRYLEGIKGDTTEYRMSLSFVQKKAKGLFYTRFNEVFDQQNTDAEPSTMQNERPAWKLRKNIFVQSLRFLYLIFKFSKWSLEYYFVPKRP